MARTVKVSEFKAKCLKLLAEVADTGEDLVVTKRGKPLARVVPERSGKPTTLQGSMKGLIELVSVDRLVADGVDDETGRRLERLAANLSPEG
jgi:prevent-host-death family protein